MATRNELIGGADSRPRIHITGNDDRGFFVAFGIGQAAVRMGPHSSAGKALDQALATRPTDQAVVIIGDVPGAPGSR